MIPTIVASMAEVFLIVHMEFDAGEDKQTQLGASRCAATHEVTQRQVV